MSRSLLIAALLPLLACSSESNALKILDVPSEAYLVLSPESLMAGGPRTPDEVGTVPSRKFDEALVLSYRDHLVDGVTLRALVVYTAPTLLPSGSVYLTSTPNQVLELAQADEETQAVLVNPESPANSGVILKERLGYALGRLRPRAPMKRSISIFAQ